MSDRLEQAISMARGDVGPKPEVPSAGPPLLDARGVAKAFGAVQALKDASLTLGRGQIVALMGANGAGKSTFVKVLTGALKPDAGHVRIRGVERRVGSPAEARRSGLLPVYQEPSLIPDLSVADNLRLTGTPAEDFRHWVAQLGIDGLRMDDTVGGCPWPRCAFSIWRGLWRRSPMFCCWTR
jgi:ribose transport system ATP-binding protein